MSDSEQLDLMVLGGGPAGVAAAIRGAQLGAKVALVEAKAWGGLCLNEACIPTKLMAAAAGRRAAMRSSASAGFSGCQVELSPDEVFQTQGELTSYLSQGTKGLLSAKGVKLIQGLARLDGPGRVRVGDEVYQAGAIVLATGARFVRPEFAGADLPLVMHSSRFLELGEWEGDSLLLGGGPWALELAQFLAQAGQSATLAVPGPAILPGEDQEISQRLKAILNQPPISILTSCQVLEAVSHEDGVQVSLKHKGESSRQVFRRVIYFERRPDYSGQGLESVGLADLSVDERLATKAKGIWAVGDATGQHYSYSHKASTLGLLAAENALGGSAVYNPRVVPRVCYTTPQAAAVGLSEEQAEEAGYEVITGEASMGVSPMAMIQGFGNGVVKVVAESKYGELLGVHVLAPMASEVIGAACLALQLEATVDDLAAAMLPHPTIAESLADAARDALGRAVYTP